MGGKGRGREDKGRGGEGKTLWICSPPRKNFLATPLIFVYSVLCLGKQRRQMMKFYKKLMADNYLVLCLCVSRIAHPRVQADCFAQPRPAATVICFSCLSYLCAQGRINASRGPRPKYFVGPHYT